MSSPWKERKSSKKVQDGEGEKEVVEPTLKGNLLREYSLH